MNDNLNGIDNHELKHISVQHSVTYNSEKLLNCADVTLMSSSLSVKSLSKSEMSSFAHTNSLNESEVSPSPVTNEPSKQSADMLDDVLYNFLELVEPSASSEEDKNKEVTKHMSDLHQSTTGGQSQHEKNSSRFSTPSSHHKETKKLKHSITISQDKPASDSAVVNTKHSKDNKKSAGSSNSSSSSKTFSSINSSRSKLNQNKHCNKANCGNRCQFLDSLKRIKRQLSEVESSQKEKSIVTTSSSLLKKDKPLTNPTFVESSNKGRKGDGFSFKSVKRSSDVIKGKESPFVKSKVSSVVETKSEKEDAIRDTSKDCNAKKVDNTLSKSVTASGLAAGEQSTGRSAIRQASNELCNTDEAAHKILTDSLENLKSQKLGHSHVQISADDKMKPCDTRKHVSNDTIENLDANLDNIDAKSTSLEKARDTEYLKDESEDIYNVSDEKSTVSSLQIKSKLSEITNVDEMDKNGTKSFYINDKPVNDKIKSFDNVLKNTLDDIPNDTAKDDFKDISMDVSKNIIQEDSKALSIDALQPSEPKIESSDESSNANGITKQQILQCSMEATEKRKSENVDGLETYQDHALERKLRIT